MELLTDQMKKKKLFLLDIDGTISFEETPFKGTIEFLNRVKEIGGNYIFITNNSTKSIADYIEKFHRMGIETDYSNFLTASYATALYLKEHFQKALVHVLGTKSFLKELRDFGLNVTEKEEADIQAVVVGFDNELTYQKVETVCKLLQTRKIDYLATNPDLACPVSFGFVPDCGAICDMIEKTVGRKPQFIGKPNPIMVDLALEQTGFSKEETVVIGDRLYTDIACGIEALVDTIVVFTGEAKWEDLKSTPFVPTYYCNDILDIYKAII